MADRGIVVGLLRTTTNTSLAPLAPFLNAALNRRVDMAIIGDSNVSHGSTSGHGQGMALAFGEWAGMYATPVIGCNAQVAINGYFQANSVSQGGAFGDSMPVALSSFDPAGINGFGGGNAAIKASGSVSSTDTSEFIGFYADKLMDETAELRFHYTYGTHSTGSGIFYPSCRRRFSLTFEAANLSGISTNTGTNGTARGYLDIPSGSRSGVDLQCQFHKYAVNAVTGPAVFFYNRMEQVNKLTGIGYSILLYQGGQSTRNAALALQGMTQTQFNPWIDITTGIQNDDGMICFHIIQGQNDDSDSSTSVGPNPAVSSTIDGIVDNHDACIIRLRTLCSAFGIDLTKVFFLIGAYHPQDSHRHQNKTYALIDYAATTYNVAVLDGDAITSPARMRLAGFYYDDGSPSTDDFHLTGPIEKPSPLENGYDTWARLTVNAIAPNYTSRTNLPPLDGPTLRLKLAAITANTTIVVPAGYKISQIAIRNTTANAVTGGIRIGKTNGAADVVVAQAVGASAQLGVLDSAVLLSFFSDSVDQTLYIQTVTSWNSASLNFTFYLTKMM